jgi:uncharacterized protein with PhoU and TrkA domain
MMRPLKQRYVSLLIFSNILLKVIHNAYVCVVVMVIFKVPPNEIAFEVAEINEETVVRARTALSPIAGIQNVQLDTKTGLLVVTVDANKSGVRTILEALQAVCFFF